MPYALTFETLVGIMVMPSLLIFSMRVVEKQISSAEYKTLRRKTYLNHTKILMLRLLRHSSYKTTLKSYGQIRKSLISMRRK